MDNAFPLLFLVVVAAAFWLLILRPAKRRAREQQSLVDSMAVGDRILMSSGMMGRIVERIDDELRVEIAPGVVVSIVDQAVIKVLADPAGTDEGAPASPTSADQI